MPTLDYLVGGLERLLLVQTSTANIVDLSPRDLTQVGYSPERRRRTMDDGGEWVESATRTLSPTVTLSDAIRLLRRMDAIDCDVIAIAIGHQKHLYLGEGCRLVPSEGLAGTGEIGKESYDLATSVKHADVGLGRDLVAGVPWEVSDVRLSDTLALLTTRDSFFDLAEDITSIGSTDDDLIGIGETGFGGVLTSTVSVGPVTGLDDGVGIAYDGTNLVLLDDDTGSEEIIVAATDGTVQKTVSYHTTSVTLGSAAYDPSTDTLYVARPDTGDVDVITDLPGTAGGGTVSQARTLTPDDGTDPLGLAIDASEDELLIATAGGVVERWDLTTSPESYVSTYTQGEYYHEVPKAWDGLALHDGAIYGHTVGGATLDVVSRWELYPPEQPSYEGRMWRVARDASVNGLGDTTNIDSAHPAVLEMTAPLGGATVQLTAKDASVTGRVQAFSPKDQETDDSGSGTDVSETFDGELFDIDGYENLAYSVRLTVESTTRRPELRVTDAGTPLGDRVGSADTDCTIPARNRAILWSPEYLSHEVQASSGDIYEWDFDDASGVDATNFSSLLILDSSGTQVASYSTASGTHTFSSAGTYQVRAIVEPDFAGVAAATLKGPVDLTTVDFTPMTDLVTAAVIEKDNSNGGAVRPFGTVQRLPSGVETARYHGGSIAASVFPDTVTTIGVARNATFSDDLSEYLLRNRGGSLEKVTFWMQSIPSAYTTEAGDIDSSMRSWRSERQEDITVDLPSFASDADDGTLERMAANDTQGSAKDFMTAMRTVSYWFQFGPIQSGEDWSGTNTNGNPVMPPGMERLLYKAIGAHQTIDDWSNAGSMNLLQVATQGKTDEVTNIGSALQTLETYLSGGGNAFEWKIEVGDGDAGKSSGDVSYAFGKTTYDNVISAGLTITFERRTRPQRIVSIDQTNERLVIEDPNNIIAAYIGDDHLDESTESDLYLGTYDTGLASQIHEITQIEDETPNADQTRVTVSTDLQSEALGTDPSAWLRIYR